MSSRLCQGAYADAGVFLPRLRLSRLLQVVAALSLLIGGSSVGARSQRAPATPQSAVLARGLKIWRKPGAIQGGAACATCHSPDGIELAAYAFDDADLERRARPHLSVADARQLVAYIHALRTKLQLHVLRDPNRDRPLQPGGSCLAGADPAARDLAFGKELQGKLPHLFGDPIETVEQAKAAEGELLRLHPVALKVGIPLNRLSEDVAHGNAHASIAQWLPEVAPEIPKKDLRAWYVAEDRYLANPTQEELHRLLLLHGRLVDTSRMLGLSAISVAKFRALLVLQDRMRNRTEMDTDNVSGDVRAYGNYNPIWEVGETAREMMDRDPGALGMDPTTQTKKLAGPALSEQMHQLRVSWFWAGWLSDQGLFKTSHDDKVRLGMWLSESLSKDGPYPIHNVFANARRQAVVSNDVGSWGEPLARRRRIWDFAGLRAFQADVKDIPKEPKYRQLYVTFTANCFRMNLLLLKDDIERTNEVWVKRNTKANASELLSFIKSEDPKHAASAEKLERELFELVDRARERR